MATYFVVGGGTGGSVDLGNGAFYSLTSGGAGGAGVPTASDDVILNTASGTNFIVNGFVAPKSFTSQLSSTPIFNGATIYCTDGSLTLAATNTVAALGSANQFIVIGSVAGTSTLNLANINLQGLANITMQANFPGAIVNLAGAINNAREVGISTSSTGTVSTAGFAVSTLEGVNSSGINISGSGGTSTLGASTLTTDTLTINDTNLNSATIIVRYQCLIFSGVIASTSTVRMLTTATFLNVNVLSTSSNLNIVQLQGDKNIIDSFSGATIATLTKTTNANINGVLELQSNITVTGTATFTGNSVINRLLVTSQNLTSPYTLSAATTSITNVDFRDITAAGTAAWTGTSVGNWLGNTGITFTTAVTRFARAAGDWTSTAIWSATNGGATGATAPLAQDTVIINNLSGSGAILVTNTNAICADLQVQSGFAGSLTINRSAYIFGSVTTANAIDVTTAASQTITLASRGTVNLSYGNRTLLDAVVQGPATTNINANLGSPAFNTNRFLVVTGTFNTNGFTVYTNSLVNAGATIALGSSEIFSYGTCTLGVMTANTASIFLMTSTVLNGTYLFNVNVAFTTAGQSVTIADGGGTVTLYGTISDKNPNYPATQNYSYGSGSVTFTTNSVWDLANGSGRVATFNGTNFINNSTQQLQTLTATFTNCNASGTFSGNDFVAFGPANLGGNIGITFPTKTRSYVFSAASAQSFVVPQDFPGTAFVTAIGGGANGNRVGGGGGAYAYSVLTGYTKGQTLYISNTNNDQDAWINTTNAPTTNIANGVLAKAGLSNRTGGSAAASIGTTKYSGGNGGFAAISGSGGGSSGSDQGTGQNAGAVNTGFGIGGTGGAGLTGTSSATTNENGSAGGNPNGGTAGVGGVSNTAGGNATAGSGGGGGGGGASYNATNVTKTGTYARASASTTLVMNITGHGMTNGQVYPYTFTRFNNGTYSKPSSTSNSPVTVTTATPHGLTSGQTVYLDFTSGNATSRDGVRTVTVTGLSTFTVIIGLGTTASGNVDLLPDLPVSSFTTTVINANQVSITTNTNCPTPTTNVSATVPVINYDNAGTSGGTASTRLDYAYEFLNGVSTTGSIGPSGGGGGGSGSFGFAGGNGGNAGSVGGGGGGRGISVLGVSGTDGTGGAGLIVFSYYPVLNPPSQGYIIG